MQTLPINRSLSTVLAKKEKGEEDKYIRQQEDAYKAEMRAKFEKILETEKKEDIVDALEKTHKPEYFVSWQYTSVLAAFGIGLPLLGQNFIYMQHDTPLILPFMLVFGYVYTQVYPGLSKEYAEYIQSSWTELQEVDNKMKSELIDAVKISEKCLLMESSVNDIYTLTDTLSVAQADVLNADEKHNLRESVASKLNSLVAAEEAASVAIRARMLSKVHTDVLDTFTNDKKAKENALLQAIAAISAASTPSGTMGKDVVGDVFKSALSTYRTEYSKIPAGGDPILVQLEKDVAEIIKLPHYTDLDAGNVYVTHPVPGFASM